MTARNAADQDVFQDAVQNALRHEYGIEGTVRPLPGEYDLNFEITSASKRFVFKVMRPGCDPEFVAMQVGALEAAKAAGLADYVPSVIRTTSGSTHISIADAFGVRRIAWLISFLPGMLMANARPSTPTLAASIGTLLGQLDRALEHFEHP